MKTLFKRIPWFYIFITTYPLLFLWTVNASEMYVSDVEHPLLLTLIGSGVLYSILYAFYRDVGKAAIAGSLILLAFFSYGHVYYGARAVPALHLLSHHSTLLILYAVLLGFGIWWVSYRLKRYKKMIRYLNIVSLLLVIVQFIQLGYYYIGSFYEARRPVTLNSSLVITNSQKPDIYFIVLDSYMRADAMQQDLGFDNSQFINQLEQLGFYVVPCSRPNYNFTRASVASTLNMQYVPNTASDSNDAMFYASITNNEVRRQLESIGYQTVSFRGDFPWAVMEDADVLFEEQNPVNLSAFESLYYRSTAWVFLRALDSKMQISQYFANLFGGYEPSTNFPVLDTENADIVRSHVNAGLFILDKLQDVPKINGPKFTFVHISIPHYPYAFGPDGEIMTDPDFYAGHLGDAVNEEYRRQGYLNQVQYINQRIIPILQTIIEDSKVPPIIILEGDHGLEADNRYTNLSAFYLPDGYDWVYDTITPVNSFRLIFNEYFGADYSLLQDITHENDVYPATGEAYPNCVK